MLRALALTSAILLIVVSQNARGKPAALLPPYFTSEASHPDSDFYSPIPNLRGVFAHGVSAPKERLGEISCVGSEAEQRAVLDAIKLDGLTEFWLYYTKSQGILFTRNTNIDPDKPCAQATRYSYQLERAFVSDGHIHSFYVDENNTFEPMASRPLTHSSQQYSGSFNRLSSLMARSKPGARDRAQGGENIAGVAADCRGIGGLVWSTVCRAKSGSLRNMILKAQAGDDEGVSFSIEILEIKPDVMLPGIVFEVDRTWSGK